MAGFYRSARMHSRIQLGLNTGKSYLIFVPSTTTKLTTVFQYYCTLPTFHLPAQAISFDLNSPHLLFLTLPNNTVRVFDVEEKLFPEWSRALTECVTQRLAQLHDPVMGIAFHPASTWSGTSTPTVRTVLLWGASWICKFRIWNDVETQRAPRKRRRGESDDEKEDSDREPETALSGLDDREEAEGKGTEMGLEVWTKYRNMLAVDFFGSEEMVIVERPFMDVMSKLPPAYFKFKYGT
jgi:U3 small nucleolar RNA-associated protein 4